MIGIDIIEINRIQTFINKFGNRALARFLNDEEIEIATSINSIAGFWAAKEAFSKAIGVGIGKELSFKDIVIRKNIKGKPFIVLEDNLIKKFNISKIDLSISHDGGFAIAAVIVI